LGGTNEIRAALAGASAADREIKVVQAGYYGDSAPDARLRIQELPTFWRRSGFHDPATGAWAPAPLESALLTLRMPYGVWTCHDGREVLFNREYRPIWERRPGEAPRAADPFEWVRIKTQRWFYVDDARPASGRRAAALLALQAWGLPAPSRDDLTRGSRR
jgi:hypothetical protein